jgi:uncharacterized membrane protein YdjX (TVP38/TMEM64 family)
MNNNQLMRVLLVLGLIAGVTLAFIYRDRFDGAALETWIRDAEVIAPLLFMLPGAIAYTYLGYAGREAVAGGEGMIQKGLLALALLAVVAFLPRLIGALRRVP